MKKDQFIFLCFLLYSVAVLAQDFAEQNFVFLIKGNRTSASRIVRHSLSKTTPFISLSAIVKGTNMGGDVEIFVWATPDGEHKKRWIAMEQDHHYENTEKEIHFPPIYLSSGTKSFRFKILKKRTSGTISLSFQAFVPADVQVSESYENNDTARGASRSCSCPQPASVSRSSWGSSYNLNANSSCNSVSYTTVTHLIVHHSAGSNTSSNWAAVVASIWNYHVNSNGWCDIGYNWLIDPNGVLYVGRGGGNNVVGAHMCGYNQKTMAVCILGNYNTATPTTAAMNKLTELLAWKCCNSNINPLGSGPINSYPGTMNNISGHKDGCAPGYTDCPGTNLYSQMNAIRQAVNNYINNGCSFSSQPLQPANDYCSGAIPLTSQTSCQYQSFTTTAATGSLPATSPCNGFTSGNADDDVWFTFQAVANQHTVRVLNGTNFDGVLDVRNGCYSSSSSIGCDDQPGSSGVLNSVTLNNLTIGNTYYVRVYHYGTGSGGGNFQICVTHPLPSCNAPGGRNTTHVTGNSAKLSWNAVSGASSYEVWYKPAGGTTYTKTTTTTTSLTLHNLLCNTRYEWGVMTYCSNGTNSGAPTSFSTFTTLNDLPVGNIQHTASGYNVSFHVSATGNPTLFLWDFGDGSPTVSSPNPTHTYPATGVPTSYTVLLTITNYCGSTTITYPFTLIPDCLFDVSPDTIFIDSSFQSIPITLTNIANCPWTASASCNFVSVWPASGAGSTILNAAVAENNDTVSRSCVLQIAGKAVFIFQSGKKAPANCIYSLTPDTVVIDSQAQFVSVQLYNPYNCYWQVASTCGFLHVAPSTGNSSAVIQLSATANHDTSLRVCNILIADKNLVFIQGGKQPPLPPKNPCEPGLPTPPIVVNGCELASSPAIPHVVYTWYKNGNVIPGVSGRFFTVEDDKGYYYVVITDSNQCTAQSNDVYVDCTLPPLGTSARETSVVNVFPNPASQVISVVWQITNADKQHIQICDVSGNMVLKVEDISLHYVFDVSQWANGIYFVTLKNGLLSLTTKLVIQH